MGKTQIKGTSIFAMFLHIDTLRSAYFNFGGTRVQFKRKDIGTTVDMEIING